MFAAGKAGRRVINATVVNVATQQNTSNGSKVTILRPTDATTGDLLVAVVAVDNGAAALTAVGAAWAKRYSSSDSPALLIASRALTAGDAGVTSFTFSSGDGTSRIGGSILAIRNAAFDSIGSATSVATTPVTISIPEVQSNYGNSMVLAVYAMEQAFSRSYSIANMSAVSVNADANTPNWGIYNRIVGASNQAGAFTASAGAAGRVIAIQLLLKPT